MAMTRRKTLALVGGGCVVAAGAGAGTFLSTRAPVRALAPWDAAGLPGDPRRRALSYALLAPSAHNRQPWLADLSAPGAVRVFRDPARNLPETDPFDRQLTVSMGCFLELMDLAAADTGHGVETALFPEGEDGPVAVARLVPGGAAPDPLFDAVLDRRSCKEPFEDRPVPADVAAALSAHSTVLTEPSVVADLRALTWAAWQVEASTPRTHAESVDLMRIGRAEIEAAPDGIDLGGPFLESLSVLGLLTRERQRDPDSFAYAEGVRLYDGMLRATPAYAATVTEGNARADQIEAGRRWLRLNLAATGLGLSLHPVSQCLQEYPEMADRRAAAHAMLAPGGGTVQMLGRLGYGPETPRTPRWPLDARIIDA